MERHHLAGSPKTRTRDNPGTHRSLTMKQKLTAQLLRSGELTRRDFALRTASSLLGVGLLGQADAAFEEAPRLKQTATATNVIYLHMGGG